MSRFKFESLQLLVDFCLNDLHYRKLGPGRRYVALRNMFVSPYCTIAWEHRIDRFLYSCIFETTLVSIKHQTRADILLWMQTVTPENQFTEIIGYFDGLLPIYSWLALKQSFENVFMPLFETYDLPNVVKKLFLGYGLECEASFEDRQLLDFVMTVLLHNDEKEEERLLSCIKAQLENEVRCTEAKIARLEASNPVDSRLLYL